MLKRCLFLLLQQPQGSPDHLARAAVAAGRHGLGNKAFEFWSEGHVYRFAGYIPQTLCPYQLCVKECYKRASWRAATLNDRQ